MQDNYPQEFDEQFISQAWLNMKQRLDKEMPVQGRQRAAWWLWLLAGLFFLGALGGSGYYFYHYGMPVPPQKTVPTARLEQGSAPGPAEVPTPAQSSEDAVHTGSRPVVRPTPGMEVSQPPTSNKVAQREEQPAKSTLPLASIKEKEQVSSQSGTAEQDIAQEKTDIIPDERKALNALPSENRSWSPLLSLIPGNIELLASSTPREASGEWRFSPSKGQSGLRLALEAGTFFLGHSSVDGLSAGLVLEAHPRRSRFYGRAGAFFRSYQQELDTEGNMLRLENSFSEISLPDGSIVNSTTTLHSNTVLNQARYLQFPLIAGFQWKPRLSFEAGLQAGFLLSSKTITSWKVEETFSMPGGHGQGDNSIYKFSDGTANEAINHTSLDIVAGLAYQPGARTSFRFTYQYGLADVLSGRTDSAFIRGLQLSLAYYLLPRGLH